MGVESWRFTAGLGAKVFGGAGVAVATRRVAHGRRASSADVWSAVRSLPASVAIVERALYRLGTGAGFDWHTGAKALTTHARHLASRTDRLSGFAQDLAQIAIDELGSARSLAGVSTVPLASGRPRTSGTRRAAAEVPRVSRGLPAARAGSAGLADRAAGCAGATARGSGPAVCAAPVCDLPAASTAAVLVFATASQQQQKRSEANEVPHRENEYSTSRSSNQARRRFPSPLGLPMRSRATRRTQPCAHASSLQFGLNGQRGTAGRNGRRRMQWSGGRH